MALSKASFLSSKSVYDVHTLSTPSHSHQPPLSFLPTKPTHQSRSLQRISAVHAADPPQNPVTTKKPSTAAAPPARTGKWTLDSWKSKKALQLPEYPDKNELESVLKTIESFPPIVFAGEARSLEERLAEAAMGNAFLLQGGDCAESFKEFSANNIRDTFRVLLQMGAVLMFGGQMPIVKVQMIDITEPLSCWIWI